MPAQKHILYVQFVNTEALNGSFVLLQNSVSIYVRHG